MRTSSAFKVALWLCASTTLGGCATQFAKDVDLRSLETVYFPEGAATPHSIGWVPDTGSFVREESNPIGTETLRLKVTFTTSVNIPKFARDRADGFSVDAHMCDRPNEDVLLVASSVYVPEQEGRPTLSWWTQERVDPPLEYFFFLNIKGSSKETFNFTYHAFDLVNEPRDVCVTLRGRSYLSPGYKSNTVIVPAAMIEAALRDLPPAFR